MLRSHNKVVGVWILREVNPIEHARKKGFPLPNGDELNRIFIQSWTMVRQASANESLYGKVESVVTSHENLRVFLIPIDHRHLMVIGCAQPCNPLVIMKNAEKLIAETNA